MRLAMFIVLATVAGACAGTGTSDDDTAFSANGHEPGWRLDIEAGQLTLLADYGELRVEAPAPEPSEVSGGRRYDLRVDGHTLAVTILDRPCTDGATGRLRSHTVGITLDGRTMTGCGGTADSSS